MNMFGVKVDMARSSTNNTGLPVRILENKHVCVQEQDVDLQPHRTKKIRNAVHVHLHERRDPDVSSEEGASQLWPPSCQPPDCTES